MMYDIRSMYLTNIEDMTNKAATTAVATTATEKVATTATTATEKVATATTVTTATTATIATEKTGKTADNNDQNWTKSSSKHIYIVSEFDARSGETKDIGYCRTRPEADHLIYDFGIKKYKEHADYRQQKKRYHVTFSYFVEEDTTRFEVREKSLGYIYNGPKTCRFVFKFTKLYRSYNSLLTPSQLEDIKKTNEEKD